MMNDLDLPKLQSITLESCALTGENSMSMYISSNANTLIMKSESNGIG